MASFEAPIKNRLPARGGERFGLARLNQQMRGAFNDEGAEIVTAQDGCFVRLILF